MTQPNESNPLENTKILTVNEMKNKILQQIDVTNDDLKVMSLQQITQFYKQLISGSIDKGQANKIKNHQIQSQNNLFQVGKQGVDQQIVGNRQIQSQFRKNIAPIHTNEDTGQTSEKQSDKRLVTQNQTLELMEVNGIEYYKPNYLTSDSYILQNQKMAILCRPYLQTKQDKIQAICYFQKNLTEKIKTLKSHEIQQTFKKLMISQNKQKFHVKLGKQIEPKQFLIYIPKTQIDIDPNFFKSSKQQKTNQQIISKSNTNQIQHACQQDKFSQKSQIKAVPKIEQKQRKSITLLGLIQQIQAAKRNLEIQQQVQTQFQRKLNKRIKTKLTVIRQIEYVQYTDDQQISPTRNERPLTDQNESQFEEQNNCYKKKNKQIMKSLSNPKQSLSHKIMKLVTNLKSFTQQFQQKYTNQFEEK